jgi:hypothetical protein
LLGRLEEQAKLLALVKLANVALAMLWGFAVTFVFVRLLPLAEFKAFLLLVAFANFTISADFGFSGIIYARLRRFRLREGAADPFNPAEIAMLLAFMLLVVVLGGLAIALCLAIGFIPTGQPALFMAFYILSALNIVALLAKRALAALDHNLLWEGMDFVRRFLSIGLLLAALAGLPILLSVCFQIGLTVAALFAGLAVVHRAIGMQAGDWLLRHSGGGILRQYARDMGATMGLTLSDVAAYNAPYLGIALATHDPRPLLVFDFLFKMSRALSAAIRALVEAGLPRLTAAYHAGRHEAARTSIGKLSLLALACAAALGGLLLLAGPEISRIMFDGKVVLGRDELLFMTALLAGLAMICVSTYVQNGLGHFGALLPASLTFLAGSVASVLLAAWLAPLSDAPFSLCFIAAYALVHLLLGLRHHLMLRGIARA